MDEDDWLATPEGLVVNQTSFNDNRAHSILLGRSWLIVSLLQNINHALVQLFWRKGLDDVLLRA
jgi:hypothetical protein